MSHGSSARTKAPSQRRTAAATADVRPSRAAAGEVDRSCRQAAQRQRIDTLFGRGVVQRETYDQSWALQGWLSPLSGLVNYASGASGKRAKLETHFGKVRAVLDQVIGRLPAAGSAWRDRFDASKDGLALQALERYHASVVGFADADALLAAGDQRLQEAQALDQRVDRTLKRLLDQLAAEDTRSRQKESRRTAEETRRLQRADDAAKAQAEADRRAEAQERREKLEASVLARLGDSRELLAALESIATLEAIDQALTAGRLAAAPSDLKAVRAVVPFAHELPTLLSLLAVAPWPVLQRLAPLAARDDRARVVTLVETAGSGRLETLEALVAAVGREGVASLARMVVRVGGAGCDGLLAVLRAMAKANAPATDAEPLVERVHGQPGALADLATALRDYPYPDSVAGLLVLRPHAATVRSMLQANLELRLSLDRLRAVAAQPDLSPDNVQARMEAAREAYYLDVSADLTKDGLKRVLDDGVATLRWNDEYQTEHEQTYGGYSQEFKLKFRWQAWHECDWVVHVHHLAEGGNKGHVKRWAQRTQREGADRILLDASVYGACRAAALAAEKRWG